MTPVSDVAAFDNGLLAFLADELAQRLHGVPHTMFADGFNGNPALGYV